MKKTTRLLTIILAIMVLATSIPTTKAEAASKIELSNTCLYFHTDLKETITQRLTLNGADASKVTWKASNGYRYNSKGKAVKTKVSKIVKVSKKGNVRALGYGEATITATYKNKKYTCNVYVADYNKQPIAINTKTVSSMTKKSDKLFIAAVKDILNTYTNPNDLVDAAYSICVKFKNIYDSYDDAAFEEHHDYDLSPFVTNWSYCDQTATVVDYFMSYFGIESNSCALTENHAGNYVVLDGHKYYLDADSGYVKFMSTQEEDKGTYDSTPWMYNEGENGNGRAYFYGTIIKDGAHLKEYFQEMKANNVTTFKFRGWANYSKRDFTAIDSIENAIAEMTGIPANAWNKIGTYSGNGCNITVENCKALSWECGSYTVEVSDWSQINVH